MLKNTLPERKNRSDHENTGKYVARIVEMIKGIKKMVKLRFTKMRTAVPVNFK